MSRFISTWSLSSSFTLPTRGKLLFPYVGLVPNNDRLWNLSIDFNTPIPNTVILEPGEHGTTGSAGYGILTVFTRSGISLSLATPCLKPTLTPFWKLNRKPADSRPNVGAKSKNLPTFETFLKAKASYKISSTLIKTRSKELLPNCF